ncbi:MAG TPA: FAD/NAD(P)-binding protein [Drouetiella sp.]
MKQIAIVGAGPSATFLVQQMQKKLPRCSITIFESSIETGSGFPYSPKGAQIEHITNVSSNEIPDLPTKLIEWWRDQSVSKLAKYGMDNATPSEDTVVPRLFFGEYLQDQFKSVGSSARANGFEVTIISDAKIATIAIDQQDVILSTENRTFTFDLAILCTGHVFPKNLETKFSGYFDSPYPPSKLARTANHPVCIRGSSLTAVDAIATLAKNNGNFSHEAGRLKFTLNEESPNFSLHMYSKSGLLPVVRVYMEEPYAGITALLDPKMIQREISNNDGFLPIDFVYQTAFLQPLKEKDRELFDAIKDLTIEEFVEHVIKLRTQKPPFELLRSECIESVQTFKNKTPIHWKELLAGLSVTMSYPAKHFSAEDRIRLQNNLMPLIGVVIALMPTSSAEQLLALHDAGVLTLTAVSDDAKVHTVGDEKIVFELQPGVQQQYKMFVDCIGQPPMDVTEFSIKGLTETGAGRQALIRFKSAEQGRIEQSKHSKNVIMVTEKDYYLVVPGFDISDHFQLVNKDGQFSEQVYMMSVPFVSGLNPDYSGLDFCDIASQKIVQHIHNGRDSKAEEVSNRASSHDGQ